MTRFKKPFGLNVIKNFPWMNQLRRSDLFAENLLLPHGVRLRNQDALDAR